MKDAKEVFDDNLQSISDMLDSNNLKGCFFLSSNLTTLVHMLDYPDAVFISEVMESVFSQVGPLLDDEKVSPHVKEKAILLLKKPFQEIIKNYNGDKTRLYYALRDFRVQATMIQFLCWKDTINSTLSKE